MPDGPATPAHVSLLVAFANTLDVDEGTDALATSTDLTHWLRDRDLLDGRDQADPDALALAHGLRHWLRDAMTVHHDGGTPDPSGLDRVAAALPLTLASDAGTPRLRPARDGVIGALSQILVAVASSVADDTWLRLKLCHASDCRWAFLDASKNRSRTWCAMGVCGNRQKTRAYRARRRTASARASGG